MPFFVIGILLHPSLLPLVRVPLTGGASKWDRLEDLCNQYLYWDSKLKVSAVPPGYYRAFTSDSGNLLTCRLSGLAVALGTGKVQVEHTRSNWASTHRPFGDAKAPASNIMDTIIFSRRAGPIAMIKGHPVDTAVVGSPDASAHQNGPGNSLQGWESGINGANINATYCIDTTESKKHSGLQTSQQSSADGGDTG
ncbi:hypothetical protein DFH09DRAFT_1099267 [Mycena vulgaris]|nr:hypothetical protein DFH09DRAFT_1099267 [Mycena vulgaris]